MREHGRFNDDSHIGRGQIEKANKTSFAKIATIVSRLAYKLANLHDDIGLCHRNIHSENIISVDDDYFLVDFRFSTASDEATEVTRSSQVHYGKSFFWRKKD
jgi:tRNA A-37 threonylcarbamoyl transferase component Bud32